MPIAWPKIPVHEWRRSWLHKLCRRGIPGYNPWATSTPRYAWSYAAARRAITFFHEELRFVEGERSGHPFDLEPWQAAIIGNLFGWLDIETGRRRYREGLVLVPRKNGKTALCTGVVLYTLLCDREPGAQVYSAAAEREQAALIFRNAARMIGMNRRLDIRRNGLCRVYRSFRAIEVPKTGSIFRALTSDADTKHGLSVHAAIVDELHAHATRDLVDVLLTATGSRRQPLVLHVTTADFARESICNEKHAYAGKVRDGVLADPSFLPVIYEAKEAEDWTSPDVWRRANPNLGVSVSLEYLERECSRAKESPAYLNTFKRLHLNVQTNADVAWIDPARWAACAGGRTFREMEAALAGRPCYAGLDLASTDDLTAFVLFFPEDGNAVLPYFWCPAENAHARERRHRVPYTAWARDGYLTLTPGNTCDHDEVERAIIRAHERFQIREVAFDRYGAPQVVTHLQGAGCNVVMFGQGYVSMSAPTKHVDGLIRSGRLAHGNHPVLRWMASNVMLRKDPADNWKPDKARSREKIDGMVALVMAVGRAQAADLPGDSTPLFIPFDPVAPIEGEGEGGDEWDPPW